MFIFSLSIQISQHTMYSEKTLKSSEIAGQEKLAKINESDTTELVFEATIDEVCQMKGCWMTLESDQKVRVTFKDYGFFVPKDAGGTESDHQRESLS